MGLPRKDVRVKLDHDIHAAMKAIAEAADLEPAEWCEMVLADVVTKRVHAASLLVSKIEKSGATRTFKDSSG